MDMTWLGKLAPTLATALAGPLGGVAVSALGKALGWDDATPEKVTALLESGNLNGDQVSAIRQAEIALKQHEADNGFKFAELEIRDRESARQREIAVRDNIPPFLAIGITLGFFGMLASMQINGVPSNGGDAFLTMLGSLGTAFIAIMNYYFGSSRGSQAKDVTIQGLANGTKP